MEKLGPGCNEPGWTTEVRCEGDAHRGDEPGCGAPLRVTKSDLYMVQVHDIGGRRKEVRFTCPCGVETNMRDDRFFTGLPDKDSWLENQNRADSR